MINDVARKGQYWWKKNKKIKKKKTLKACLTRAQNLFPPSGVWMQKWSTQFALFHELSLFGLVSCSPGLGYLTARRYGPDDGSSDGPDTTGPAEVWILAPGRGWGWGLQYQKCLLKYYSKKLKFSKTLACFFTKIANKNRVMLSESVTASGHPMW